MITLFKTFTVTKAHKYEQNKTRTTGTYYEHIYKIRR